jgi:hypothetical protein
LKLRDPLHRLKFLLLRRYFRIDLFIFQQSNKGLDRHPGRHVPLQPRPVIPDFGIPASDLVVQFIQAAG